MKKITSNKKVLKKSKSTKKTLSPNKKDFFIVGIGASAGGLKAFKLFFDNTPSNSGMAFIIVQHLDPEHKSLLRELIAEHTKMKVSEISDGMNIQPNNVYIIPPKKNLKIFHNTLQLIGIAKQRAPIRPIDSFFHSLAEDKKNKAIGIVLSGTGSEGTLGLQEIRKGGGIAIVQDPKSAQFDGMPLSAIAAKTADYILLPEQMPAKLIQYVKKNNSKISGNQSELVIPTENQLKKIFMVIRYQTGYDFSSYKTNTIIRRITKRIVLNQITSIDDYIHFLQTNPLEVEKLYKDFLIGVTSFFRDEEVFGCIREKVIPPLLEKSKEKQELRIWVCGCSTGEEAYSLAILFSEALEKNKKHLKVLIFATDIDKEAIKFARTGIYPESIAANVNPEQLSKYFTPNEHGYQVKRETREMVVFAHHNVIKDPPFSKMDLITCRNLLIYMNSDLQKKIIPIFHYSLNGDGILVLGTSESLGDYSNLFSVFDNKIKIYKKKRNITLRKTNREFELTHILYPTSTKLSMQNLNSKKKIDISNITEKILLNNYAPPYVIIDKNNDILYFSGNTGLYLEPPKGEARLNILEMAKNGLKIDLKNAISKVRISKKEVRTNEVEVKVNDHFQPINLIVKPLLSKEIDLGALIIIFETAKESSVKSNGLKSKREKVFDISDLQKELKITREHLQTAIDELEISNENLQTTNEEFQSSNEELQSTNEELETSREELQSVNEELITMNTELQDKIEQLSQANDDLNNLLRSIEVATVYLDRDLKIKRFTPAATKIFNLIPSDIDRSVTHLSSNLLYKELADDVKYALKTLAVKSVEVPATDSTWYGMRIIPYRTAENIIEGVLVTFVDITEQKRVEEKLKTTNEHLNLIMENLPAIPYTCVADPAIKISFVGKSCEKVTGFLPEQFTHKTSFWISRIHPEDKKTTLASFSAIAKKEKIDKPFRWKCADGKYKQFINYIRYAAPKNGRPAYIVGVWQEIEKNKELKIHK